MSVPGVASFWRGRERAVPDHLVLAPFAAEAPSVGLCCSALGAGSWLSTGWLAFWFVLFYGGQWVCIVSVSVLARCLHQWGGDCTELPRVLSHNRMKAKFKKEHFLAMRRTPFLTRLRKVALVTPPFTTVISCGDKQSVNYFPESPEVFVILIKSISASTYRTSMGSLAPAAVNIFNLPRTEEKLSSFHFASA